MIKVHPLHIFKQDQWFNIPEDVHNLLTQMRRDYQYNKSQRTNNYNGKSDYNQRYNGIGNQFGSYQAEISQAKSVPYGGSVIYPIPSHMGTHMIPPPQPPPQYISVKQVNKFQQQQQHDDKATEISAVNTSGFIMGRRNEQSSL